MKHDQCASTLFNINVSYACIMSPDIYIADHATCATALSPRQDYYYLYYKITEGNSMEIFSAFLELILTVVYGIREKKGEGEKRSFNN